MISFFNLCINAVESFTTSFLAVNFLSLKHQHKSMYILVLTILLFIVGTFFNITVGYESFYLIFYSLSILLFAYLISTNSTAEIIILILLLGNIVSLSNFCFLVPACLISHKSIFFMYNDPQINAIFCIFVRLFHILWGFALLRYKKQLGDMITEYNKLFLFIILEIYLGILGIENIAINNIDVYDFYILLAEFSFLTINLTILYFIYVTRKKYLTDIEKQKILSFQNSSQEQLAQIQETNKKVSTIRHNLSNKLFVIKQYLLENDLTNALNAINNEIKNVENMKNPILTGNNIVDSLINSKIEKAKQNNISITCQIDKNCIPVIDTMSLCIILGNALDNAIEHNSKTDPFINFSIQKENNFIKIEICNSTDCLFNDLKTTKADAENHGFGISSIRSLVKDNNGKVLFTQREDYFTCLIELLSNNQ